MDNALYYLAINRQIGLTSELNAIANNIANVETTGFRKETTLFSEFVVGDTGGESVSMADGAVRFASERSGSIRVTGGTLDLAIEGPGYFMLEDGDGQILTRAGAFQTTPDGFVSNPVGQRLLDAGGAPVFVPPDASSITISRDGTLSVDGVEQARIGVVTAPSEGLTRAGNAGFMAEEGIAPLAEPRLLQGALESSNVDPIEEIARLISVSRAYEQVRGLIDDEDNRIRQSVQTLGEPV